MGMFGNEKNFEDAIERSFISPEGGYEKGSHLYDKKLALYVNSFINFIKDSQEDAWNKYLGKSKTQEPILEFCNEFIRQIEKKGVLEVLRNGFKVYGIDFKTAYFRPESKLNPDTERLYKLNVCECYRQWYYSENTTESVDMVLVLNGLPVFAFELKNQITGQAAKEAKKQWCDRYEEGALCFSFNRRVLAYFSVDPYEVWMTTKPESVESFLPFNQGS